MKKVALLFTLALLLSSCSSTSNKNAVTVDIAPCTSLSLLDKAPAGVDFGCLDGEGSINFSALKGPLIVNVWASWCAACKQELPIFLELHKVASAKVSLLGIDVEEKSEKSGFDFARTNGMAWPHLYDPDGRSAAIFGLGIPVTWFIDSKGAVTFKKIGVIKDFDEMKDLISKYLGVEV